jgi:hypothetical protein
MKHANSVTRSVAGCFFTGLLVLMSSASSAQQPAAAPAAAKGLLGQAMKKPTKQFALCLENEGNEASLILGKVYRILPDARAAKDDFVRIVDESGEDYLFHKSQFAFVDFPQAVRKRILALQEAS